MKSFGNRRREEKSDDDGIEAQKQRDDVLVIQKARQKNALKTQRRWTDRNNRGGRPRACAERKRRTFSCPMKENLWEPTYNEEIYTQRQVSNLGDRKSEWQLFVSRVRPTRSTVVRQQQRRVLSPVQAENAGNAHDVQEVQHDAREVLRGLHFYAVR